MATDGKFHISNPNGRGKIRGFLTFIPKFAVDFAVNVSIKGVTDGKKVYKIVEERLMNQSRPLSVCDEKKQKDIEAAKDMQATMEELQEDMINLKQQNKTSAELAQGSTPQKKIPNEGTNGSDRLKTNKDRIFIRSRL